MSTPLLALMLNTLRRGGDRCESDVRCDGEAGRWPVGLAPEQTHQRLLHQLSGSSSWALTAAATLFTNCTVQYQHNQPTNQAHLPMHSPCSPGSGSGSIEACRALRRSAACSGCRRCGPSVTMDPSEQKMVVTASLSGAGEPSRPEAPPLRSNSGASSSPPQGLLPPAHQRAPPAPRAPCSRLQCQVSCGGRQRQ